MISREDIQIISRNSNWSEANISTILEKKIYNDKQKWQKFLQLFFMSLGISFTVAGILFFFAYNWDDLHKFVKIGLVEGLIVVLTLVAVFTKIKPEFKNILLTGVTMLVGVLFAVFGQIYQTGANAYDFFFGWTMAVALWVVVSNFAALWLLFIVLINVTFFLYVDQVAPNWEDLFVFIIVILANTLFLIASLLLKAKAYKVPNWFTNLLAFAVVSFVTVAFMDGIFDSSESYFGIIVIMTFVLYPLGIYYGLKQKRSFYLSIIPLSIIMIIAALFIKIVDWDDFSVLLFIGLFVVISVTLVIKILMKLQKKWHGDELKMINDK